MKAGRLQAKDIDDRKVLSEVRRLSMDTQGGRWPNTPHWVMARDLEKALGLENTGRLLLAKCDALIRRKLLDGCTCGCRGDFELTAAGRAFLAGPTEQASEDQEKK